jgi:hypothetical protein
MRPWLCDRSTFTPPLSVGLRQAVNEKPRPKWAFQTGQSRRFRRHPGNYPQHGHGCYRPSRIDEPRAHHRPGADGKGLVGTLLR